MHPHNYTHCDKMRTHLWHKAGQIDMKILSFSDYVSSRASAGLWVFSEESHYLVAGRGTMFLRSDLLAGLILISSFCKIR